MLLLDVAAAKQHVCAVDAVAMTDLREFVWGYARCQQAQGLPHSYPDCVGTAGLAGLSCAEPRIRAAAAAAAWVCYAQQAVCEGRDEVWVITGPADANTPTR
jgi:hypothetical protein